jgi:hypothetical protein
MQTLTGRISDWLKNDTTITLVDTGMQTSLTIPFNVRFRDRNKYRSVFRPIISITVAGPLQSYSRKAFNISFPDYIF